MYTQRSAYNHFFLMIGGVCFKFSETWTHVDVGNLWCVKPLPFLVEFFLMHCCCAGLRTASSGSACLT